MLPGGAQGSTPVVIWRKKGEKPKHLLPPVVKPIIKAPPPVPSIAAASMVASSIILSESRIDEFAESTAPHYRAPPQSPRALLTRPKTPPLSQMPPMRSLASQPDLVEDLTDDADSFIPVSPSVPLAYTGKSIVSKSLFRSRSQNHLSYTGMGIILEQQCVLCGKTLDGHKKNHHVFIATRDEYRCKICGMFFYEHDHSKNSCYTPYKPVSA